MEKTHDDIDRVIAQWLSGELTEEKKQQFDAWINMHPDNATEASKLKMIWDLTSQNELPMGESFESRWQRLEESTAPGRNQLWPIYKVAASLLAVVFVSVILMLWIRAGELVVHTQNAELKNILLPDSSSVTLNAGSGIRYNPRLWFLRRKVQLEGEAFFNVSHNGETFTVETAIAATKVLGTSFNIRERNNALSVSCLTGKVGVTLQAGYEDYIILERGNQCNVRNGQVFQSVFDLTNSPPIAWTEKKLHFERTPLQEVFDEIVRFYDVKIKHSLSATATFTGTFENATPEEVVKMICLSSGLHYTMGPGKEFTISE